MKYIKSPINYAGSKYRIIKEITSLFPKEIDTFIDLFGGAGNITINAKAKRIIYNEIIDYLPELFNYWKNNKKEDINKYIDDTILKYNLNQENLEGFIEFRKHYNEEKNIADLFILLCFSFNYQMRFNNKREYNSSFGKSASTMNDNIRNNLNTFIDYIQSNNINFVCKDFRELKIEKLTDKSFVYLDPPYLISCGVYQDGKRGFNGWTQQDDIGMMNLCDKLDNKGIKFCMSNMLESKGKINQELYDWSKKYNVIKIQKDYKNSNYQRKNIGKDLEVAIVNYNIDK